MRLLLLGDLHETIMKAVSDWQAARSSLLRNASTYFSICAYLSLAASTAAAPRSALADRRGVVLMLTVCEGCFGDAVTEIADKGMSYIAADARLLSSKNACLSPFTLKWDCFGSLTLMRIELLFWGCPLSRSKSLATLSQGEFSPSWDSLLPFTVDSFCVSGVISS